MSLICTFQWAATLEWVQITFCAEGTCEKPGYDGNTVGEFAYMPCALGVVDVE